MVHTITVPGARTYKQQVQSCISHGSRNRFPSAIMAIQRETPTIPVVTISRAADDVNDSDGNPFDSGMDDIISRSSDESEYDPSETSSDRASIASDHESDEVDPSMHEEQDADQRPWLVSILHCGIKEWAEANRSQIEHDGVPVPEAVVRKRVVKMAGQPAFTQYLVRGTWWVTPRYGNQVDALIAAFDRDLDRRYRSRTPGPN